MLTDQPRLAYPPTRREDVVEDHHGLTVADPYRWLEDPENPAARDWAAAQQRLTRGVLDELPWRHWFRDRIGELWRRESCHTALFQNGRVFAFRNDGTQEQDVLHVQEGVSGTPRVLVDPSALGDDRGPAVITYATPSPDGRRLAYSLSFGGSDWQEWRVRDVDSGKDLPDRLQRSKLSAAGWTADGSGFFYTRYPPRQPGAPGWEPDRHPEVALHRLGDPQDADEVVHRDPEHPEQGITVLTTEDGAALVLFVWRGDDTATGILAQDLTVPDAPVVGLLPHFDAAYTYVGGDGPLLWFLTDLDAPNGRIVLTDLRRPGGIVAEVVPEGPHPLQGASIVGGRLFVVRLVDGASRIAVHSLEGARVGEVALPGAGTVEGLRSQPHDTETLYSFTSWTRPATVYRLEVTTGHSEAFFAPSTGFDPDDFAVEQVRYPAADGTLVPLALCRHRDVEPDGARPVFLTAYGGFGMAITPAFTPGPIAWMEAGGVFAVAGVRGGGEYGEAWHDAGAGRNKGTAVDDLLAAAEWLQARGWTRPGRLALGGISNGGLLVAAALTRRPDLFACALPVNGVMDLVRFRRFTIGWSWVFEYGDPDDPEDFAALYTVSPLHRLEPGRDYPATLVCTSARDDRVVPAHSYKFAAALQAAQAGPAPVLLRVDGDAGHARDARRDEGLDDLSGRWAFAASVLGMPPP